MEKSFHNGKKLLGDHSQAGAATERIDAHGSHMMFDNANLADRGLAAGA